MLCIWWDWNGIVYYAKHELNSGRCCYHLDRLKVLIEEECPELANPNGVVFYQGNVRPGRNWYNLAGCPTAYFQIPTKFLLMVKILWKPVKKRLVLYPERCQVLGR